MVPVMKTLDAASAMMASMVLTALWLYARRIKGRCATKKVPASTREPCLRSESVNATLVSMVMHANIDSVQTLVTTRSVLEMESATSTLDSANVLQGFTVGIVA